MSNDFDDVCDNFEAADDEFNTSINSLRPEGMNCKHCKYSEADHRAKIVLRVFSSNRNKK
jgi:hypothetical protein